MGSISDREIVYRSNIIKLLEAWDLVLADRGFTIQDILETKKAFMNIWPFLKDRKCLTSSDEIKTKVIAKQRIYVQHAIGRLTKGRLLQHVFPLSMRGMISEIVFVCGCSTLFQKPRVLDSLIVNLR